MSFGCSSEHLNHRLYSLTYVLKISSQGNAFHYTVLVRETVVKSKANSWPQRSCFQPLLSRLKVVAIKLTFMLRLRRVYETLSRWTGLSAFQIKVAVRWWTYEQTGKGKSNVYLQPFNIQGQLTRFASQFEEHHNQYRFNLIQGTCWLQFLIANQGK